MIIDHLQNMQGYMKEMRGYITTRFDDVHNQLEGISYRLVQIEGHGEDFIAFDFITISIFYLYALSNCLFNVYTL